MSGIFRNGWDIQKPPHKGSFIAKLNNSTLKINKNQEKKWHRYLKMDKNKCPILKSGRKSL